jgi:hypothetical protein
VAHTVYEKGRRAVHTTTNTTQKILANSIHISVGLYSLLKLQVPEYLAKLRTARGAGRQARLDACKECHAFPKTRPSAPAASAASAPCSAWGCISVSGVWG